MGAVGSCSREGSVSLLGCRCSASTTQRKVLLACFRLSVSASTTQLKDRSQIQAVAFVNILYSHADLTLATEMGSYRQMRREGNNVFSETRVSDALS